MLTNHKLNSSYDTVFPKVSMKEYSSGILTVETLVRIQRGNYWLVPVSHSVMVGGLTELKKREIELSLLHNFMEEVYKIQFLYKVQTRPLVNSRNQEFIAQYEDENQESEVERLKK